MPTILDLGGRGYQCNDIEGEVTQTFGAGVGDHPWMGAGGKEIYSPNFGPWESKQRVIPISMFPNLSRGWGVSKSKMFLNFCVPKVV